MQTQIKHVHAETELHGGDSMQVINSQWPNGLALEGFGSYLVVLHFKCLQVVLLFILKYLYRL